MLPGLADFGRTNVFNGLNRKENIAKSSINILKELQLSITSLILCYNITFYYSNLYNIL